MFEYIKHRRRARKIKIEMQNLKNDYAKREEILYRQKKDLRELRLDPSIQDSEVKFELLAMELGEMNTQFLSDQAEKYGIDLPEKSNEEMWESVMGHEVLSVKGQNLLNRQIEDEKRKRKHLCLQIMAVIIGLIGALTGLILVIKSFSGGIIIL